jgi:AraC-like DNA-binding protein
MPKKVGRPHTKVKDRIEEKHFDLEVIQKLAFHGLIDKEICDILNVSEMTLNRWKQDAEFMLALKKGKLEADLRVERALYERATGYEHEDTYFSNYRGLVTATPYIKHYPPDTAAAFIWLKNRRSEKWRDKMEVEHSGGITVLRDTIASKLANKQNASTSS